MSVPSPDDRELLHGIENDWREAIAAIHDAREEEAKAFRRQLAAIHAEYRRLGKRLLGVAAGLLVVVVGGLAAQGFTLSRVDDTVHRVDDLTASTSGALCALRRDLEVRAEQGRAFLHDHPNGYAGFTASAVRVAVMGQERTIAALSNLECGAP